MPHKPLVGRLGQSEIGRLPHVAEMTDAQLATALDKAIALIDPVLDLMAERDPLGLKEHTFDEGAHPGRLAKVQHLAAEVLNVTDWPGTAGWSELSTQKRINWWVNRIGAINTIAVSYPGVFGAWAKALPLSSSLGFANQALVLTAVGRELGVTDRNSQIRMLASVLCGRDLPTSAFPDTNAPADSAAAKQRRSVIRSLWDIAQILRKVNDTISKRPMPKRPFSTLAWVPLIGAPTLYVGERMALCRAAKAGQEWVGAHPGTTTDQTA